MGSVKKVVPAKGSVGLQPYYRTFQLILNGLAIQGSISEEKLAEHHLRKGQFLSEQDSRYGIRWRVPGYH